MTSPYSHDTMTPEQLEHERRAARRPLWTPGSGAFAVGLDLGQSQDYSALVACEFLLRPTDRTVRNLLTGEHEPETEGVWHVLHAQRWPLGTRYGQVLEETARLIDLPPLRHRTCFRMDKTGLGAPIAEEVHLARANNPYRTHAIPFGPGAYECINITSGAQSKGLNIPKRHLVTNVEVLLQDGRLKWADALPLRDVFEEELAQFRVKVTQAGNDTYEAGPGFHDDLVLALALAVHDRPRGNFVPRYIYPDGSLDDYEEPGWMHYPVN